MLRLILFSLSLSITSMVHAQICSTPQEPLLARTDENKRSMMPVERGILKYIPVTFHLVAASNGTGRVSEENVLHQVASINAQFEDQEAIFYIDRFNYFDNDAVFNTPASSAAKVQMRLRKDNNSINVFITNTADSGSGGPGITLAYYDPQDDWIVSRKSQINGVSSTLAHEVGHFFSLAHPHAGWDCHPFTLDEYTNPVNVTHTIACEGGGGSLLIELHDRSNCNTAGDRICDTPEDYNLGLLFQNGCAQNTTVMDINGDLITPMVNNFMGYYNNCASYAFTQIQKNLINTDFFSFQRNYIRTGVIPNTTLVEDPVTYISPINGDETSGTTNIRLDWEDTPGANKYLVIYDRFSSFTFSPVKKIVTASELIIEDELLLGVTYHWKVWPYNESRTGAGYSQTQNFRVGTGTAVNEIREINEYNLSPNPVSAQEGAFLSLIASEPFSGEIRVSDVSGRILFREGLLVPSGFTQHPIQTSNLRAGIYFVILHSTKGQLIERLLVTD